METFKYKLSLSGQVATLNAVPDDVECPMTIAWEQDQFFGHGRNTFHRKPGFILPNNACGAQKFCLKPSLAYTAENDGFAVAESPFDESKGFLSFIEDPELPQFWAMKFNLTASPIPHDIQWSDAFVLFHKIAGDINAKVAIDNPSVLPDDAPLAVTGDERVAENTGAYARVSLEGILRSALAGLDGSGSITELVIVMQITPSGDSEGEIQVASSRHATLPGPRLVIVQ